MVKRQPALDPVEGAITPNASVNGAGLARPHGTTTAPAWTPWPIPAIPQPSVRHRPRNRDLARFERPSCTTANCAHASHEPNCTGSNNFAASRRSARIGSGSHATDTRLPTRIVLSAVTFREDTRRSRNVSVTRWRPLGLAAMITYIDHAASSPLAAARARIIGPSEPSIYVLGRAGGFHRPIPFRRSICLRPACRRPAAGNIYARAGARTEIWDRGLGPEWWTSEAALTPVRQFVEAKYVLGAWHATIICLNCGAYWKPLSRMMRQASDIGEGPPRRLRRKQRRDPSRCFQTDQQALPRIREFRRPGRKEEYFRYVHPAPSHPVQMMSKIRRRYRRICARESRRTHH